MAFEALLMKPSVPEAVPEACGAKAMVIGTLCPAAIVSGKIIPLRENSGLFKLAEDTVTLAPVAPRFPAREVLVPTVTLPKFAELGETDNWPCAVLVPVWEIVSVGFDASELTMIVPVAVLAVCGVKVVLNVRL
jgi:hypothetical protein